MHKGTNYKNNFSSHYKCSVVSLLMHEVKKGFSTVLTIQFDTKFDNKFQLCTKEMLK